MPDAVVIGAGPNGLVAANLLADAGWDVVVLEAQPEPGGAVRTGELTLPGYRHDLFSAFYPLAVASPHMQSLRLEEHGLRWLRAPLVLAHPQPDGACAAMSTDLDESAALLGEDGDAWRAMYREWGRLGADVVRTLFTPFPPVRAAARLAVRLSPSDLLRFGRRGLLPARRFGEERFRTEGPSLLLAGCALHTDLTPEAAGGGLFGWLLACVGQQHGFPVPEGGAGSLTDALVRRLHARGGRVVCGQPVTGVEVRGGRAVAVRVEGGEVIDAGRAVLADVSAPSLYLSLLPRDALPASLLADMAAFQWDAATVKVDWALSGPIPWSAEPARRAGTVHVADDLDNFTEHAAHLAMRQLPARPFLIVGQQSMTDPTRQPAGAETAWAYTHVPREVRGDAAGEDAGEGAGEGIAWDRFVARMEARIEALAPGFGERILGRHVFTPASFEAADANLSQGALNGGTAQLHQQLVFRPVPGLGRAETPVKRLYLASASAHPGGGVHGGPGANAARAALLHHRLSAPTRFWRT
jgi:phytoene dehydrogenase-like protein